ncbi:MAG: guanylate kinase [Limnospira sp. PMC 894.15]|uniref:guanylate kinase n=1 Tax=Limnospira TaxID=2596745 RepID=UPI0028E10533|nr:MULTISPECIES: guanylate kinase [unclassified Limnospira]MDT9190387.1 guanylate kinase [Limnospira sp. PMC 894.15]MDT9277132.1 guanylate kinase [Limnospira sp. PMC 737.11]MDY7051367.1 guanylate kinase [Limnospira fusiformis LS22]
MIDSKTGQLIVITGPSGVGKGTIIRSLLQKYPQLHLSVSVTTRSPRPGEVHGKDYFFVTRDRFQQMVQQQELLEWAEFAGNFYGTPRLAVQDKIQQGENVLLEIELEGARQISQTFPQALRIFILPPSLQELENRLRNRATDSQEAIARRIQRAQTEIAAAGEFHHTLINDNLDRALAELETLF